MGKAVRISVIGAGSGTFSLGLVKDLCLTTSLAGSTVSFMDIDAERLAFVAALARRYADELGMNLRIEETTDRAASLAGADFVINTAAVHSHIAQRRARELTAEHGYYYGGGLGLGHFANIQLMLDVVRDMERICPDAWLIQSGNPVFAGCTAMTRASSVKVCGLCHGHYGVYHMTDVLGLDPQRVTWQAPGVNHNIWLNHFLYDGEDAYPLLDRWIAEHGEEYWRTHVAERTHDIQMSRGAINQYRLYGLMPIGDTVRRGGWWYHSDLATKKRWFGEPWGGPDTELARPFYVANLDKKLAQMDAVANDRSARVTDVFGTTRTREQQVPIIDALTNNTGGFFQVNVPNGGTIQGIANDVVVETPAYIDATGIHPVKPSPLPAKIMLQHVLPEILDMERDLLAFQSGDRAMLLWQVLDAHQTRTYDQGVAVLNDLLALEGHESLAAHFRWPRESDGAFFAATPQPQTEAVPAD